MERAGSPPRGGFTLLEILLALALLGLLSAVLIGGGAKLFSEQPVTPDELFWKAAGEARLEALKTGHDVRLASVDDPDHGKRLVMTSAGGSKEFPLNGPGELTVSFLPVEAVAGGSAILAGQVVELQSLPFVTFYEDGTCSGFRVQVRVGVASHTISLDRWTCAPILLSSETPGS